MFEAIDNVQPGNITFVFKRRPFILRPERKRGDRSVGDRYVWREVLQGLGKTQGWYDGMQAAGASRGIHFDFEGEVGNSLDSLRLVQWADKFDKQEELSEELAIGHFEKRKCVCDFAVMLEACEAVGLPVEEASVVLHGDAFLKEVLEGLEAAAMAGHHSIPVFTFDGKHQVHGSASVEEFEQVIHALDTGRI